MSEMRDKLEYRSRVTAKEIKELTRYDEYKETIDAITGEENLDFPFKEAEVNEYEIKMVLPDGNYLFLPIIATDEQGHRHDKRKGYTTIHRPETKEEIKRREEAEKRKAQLAKEKAKAEKEKEKEKEEKKTAKEKAKK